MSIFIQWIQQIMIFFILVTIIEMLLPNSTLKKHIRLAIGLVLILLFIQPIFNLFKVDVKNELNKAITTFSQDVTNENSIENLIDLQKREIDQQVDAYTLEQAGEELIEIVQAPLQEEYGVIIRKVNFEYVEDLTDIVEEKEGAVLVIVLEESEKQKGVVEEIQEITVLEEGSSKNDERYVDEEGIKKTIASSWEIGTEQLQIEWVGGT